MEKPNEETLKNLSFDESAPNAKIKRQIDGFVGAQQIDIPESALARHLNLFYITHIGYYPNAQFHYRRRENGCNDYILIYCLNGKGHYTCEQGSFTVKPNQFILLTPHQFHCYQSDIDDPWTIYWVHFTGKNIEDLKADLNLDRFSIPTDLPYNEKTIELWQEMYSSILDGFSTDNMNYANLSLYRFISFFLFPTKAKYTIKESKKVDPLEQSITFMKTNIHRRLSAEEIAKEFNFSASHYSALFKKKTGLSPIDFFIRIKIRYACQLLTQSNLIVKEVAEKIGYDDPYNFSRIFKKITGSSPLEYKKTIHKKFKDEALINN
ncbi:AraC family transcriptional regulator [Solitalea koreensis]|uniref:AraC-like ligand binding domain-containing protein n=1 Tax=Solitalea koreensis TaxID=543615 RepID=A0A521DKH0_9SPHI|nr:AraC family transcriptional regulator [Solitalea koreensis]SMO71591.1 AraC-like ligand binding domain-containing protein [Solitalea koreensis]